MPSKMPDHVEKLMDIWDRAKVGKAGFYELTDLFDKTFASQKDHAQVSHDGKHWEPAKYEPYYNMGLEKIKCFFGFHELRTSKRYAHTKTCFRCGIRKTGQKEY